MTTAAPKNRTNSQLRQLASTIDAWTVRIFRPRAGSRARHSGGGQGQFHLSSTRLMIWTRKWKQSATRARQCDVVAWERCGRELPNACEAESWPIPILFHTASTPTLTPTPMQLSFPGASLVIRLHTFRVYSAATTVRAVDTTNIGCTILMWTSK